MNPPSPNRGGPTRCALLLGMLALLGAPACTTETESDDGDDPYAPEFPEGMGQQPAADSSPAYPAPPHGFGVGAVVPDFEFLGYANPVAQAPGALQLIRFADFYNPTGDGVYGEGAAFPVGTPKPKALLFDISAVWCPVCNQEAKDVLPDRYRQYGPDGGQFLVVLMEGTSGYSQYDPATHADLDLWAQRYDQDFPLVMDPTDQLDTLMPRNAVPANLIIDTRTMRLVTVLAGGPSTLFWSTFRSVIDGTYQPTSEP